MNNAARRWISPREAADYLSLHPMTIYSMIAEGRIPAVHLGRAVRVDLKRLEEILNQQIEGGPVRKRGRK